MMVVLAAVLLLLTVLAMIARPLLVEPEEPARDTRLPDEPAAACATPHRADPTSDRGPGTDRDPDTDRDPGTDRHVDPDIEAALEQRIAARRTRMGQDSDQRRDREVGS